MAIVEKRSLDEVVLNSKHIVLDIEGTTTSISFVKDTLFPYVRENLEKYLVAHWDEEEFKSVLTLLKNQAEQDKKAGVDGVIEIPSDGTIDDQRAAALKNVLWQMDSDRKTTALKKLQGHMWRQGYKSGELKGHLYADVAPALREWVKDGRKLYVYSSGSVEAQKLLFGHSTEGDLTELFSDFFDTEVGAKVDAESYKAILQKLKCSADDVLFLTDMLKEANAARQAGLPVMLVEREGSEIVVGDALKEFSAVSSFQDISFDKSSKKQKLVEDGNQENGVCDHQVSNGATNHEESTAMEVEKNDSEACDSPTTEKQLAKSDMKVEQPRQEADVENESVNPSAEVNKAIVVNEKTEDQNKEKCSEGESDNTQTTSADCMNEDMEKPTVSNDTSSKSNAEFSSNIDPKTSDTSGKSTVTGDADMEEGNHKLGESDVKVPATSDKLIADQVVSSIDKEDDPVKEKILNDLPAKSDGSSDVSKVEDALKDKSNQMKTDDPSDTSMKTEETNIQTDIPSETLPSTDNMKDVCKAPIPESDKEKDASNEPKPIEDLVSSDKTDPKEEVKTEDEPKLVSEDVSPKNEGKSPQPKDTKTEETVDTKLPKTVSLEEKEVEITAVDTNTSETEVSRKEMNGLSTEKARQENGDTNGAVENGHEDISKEGIPDVVTKNNPDSQADNSAGETEIAVKA